MTHMNLNSAPSALRKITSFGRRHTRKLSLVAESTLSDILPAVQLSLDKLPFFEADKTVLEVGFGDGSFLAQLARSHPDMTFIGAEVFDQGIVKLCRHISEASLGNIRIWPDDALVLLNSLPDNFLTTVYILFPDPWPKLRHHKRRLVQSNNLELIARKLLPNGSIIIATDHPEYANWIERSIGAVLELRLLDNTSFDFEGLRTKYRSKALASPNVYGFEVTKSA